jgi:hypothetical protein
MFRIVHADSANINERSMAGTRATEIATMIWQPIWQLAHILDSSVDGAAPALARGQNKSTVAKLQAVSMCITTTI